MIDRRWLRPTAWPIFLFLLAGIATNPAPAADSSSQPQSLPWNRPVPGGLDPAANRLSSAREMLELFNVGDSELQQFADGRPLIGDEEESLWKILFNMPRFGPDKLHAWRREGVVWQELADAPERHRIEVFELQGRVRRATRMELPPESAVRMEFAYYYQVDLSLSEAPNPVTISTRNIPDAWRQQAELDERAACLGLFLKSGPGDQSAVPLFFAAERIAWMPDRPRPQWRIGQDEILLGDLGVDVGLLDAVRQTNGRALVASDREPFYQILAATGRVDRETVFRQASRQFDLGQLLNQPAEHQGRLLAFYARARRVQKIVIDDPEIRARLGIQSYYQIDLQVPLGDQEVRLVTRPGETDGPVFRNSYPAHCNVLQLPDGLPDRPNVDQQLLVAGFYFKLWAYRTEYVQTFGQEKRQLGPLFLAVTPRVIEQRNASNPLWGWIGGAVFLATLAGIAGTSWLLSRSDRRFHRRMRTPRTTNQATPQRDPLPPSIQPPPNRNRNV